METITMVGAHQEISTHAAFPSPHYEGRRRPCTADYKQEPHAFPTRTSNSFARTKSSRKTQPPRTPSPSGSDSSDDDFNAPLTPPPIISQVSSYIKTLKKRPKPYQRNGPNIIERLCGEECPGCDGSRDPLGPHDEMVC
jgi:hypothetical protein